MASLKPVDYFQLPLPTNSGEAWGVITAYRRSLGLGPHRGQDCIAAAGTPFRAIADGVVVTVGRTGCLGWYTVLKHLLRAPDVDGDPRFVYSGYCHQPTAPRLKVGQVVKRGQVIGKVGQSGTCASGPHLHFTVGDTPSSVVSGETRDPAEFIREHGTPPRAGDIKQPVNATVREHQTLSDIAADHGTTVAKLMRLNRGKIADRNRIRIGQVLRIR